MTSDGSFDAVPIRIAVAGNPNSGKTTVFNNLTGLRAKVGNYPGVTVEKREGFLRGTPHSLLDLPGTYSLSARSPDEELARDVLLGRVPGTTRPDAVLLVIDASNLERNLYLASQVLEFGMPVVIACNMMDAAAARGQFIDCAALSRELGVPVIGTVAATGEGLDAVRDALLRARSLPPPPPRSWKLPEPMEEAARDAAAVMEASGVVPARSVRGGAVLWLMDYLAGDAASRRSAERFLTRLQPAHAKALRGAADRLLEAMADSAAAAVEARYEWISGVAARVVRQRSPQDRHDFGPTSAREPTETLTDRIDRILTHRVLGLGFFAGVMFLLFLSIFSWAEPLMGLIEAGQGALAAFVTDRMTDGPLRSLLTDGVIAGVGAVVIFFPQICILFFCLALLEDSGYMARAAFLMDRLMSRVGLHGKSFIPLLSSYACAIPGIMATRTIEDRRDRFTTILIAPLMSCSARLPVYIILIAAVFGDRIWLKAGVMFGLYALGTVTAMLLALLFKKTLFAGPRPAFILELPSYHVPRVGALLRSTWDRSKLFLTNAGTVIFCVSVIVWALSYFPHYAESELPPDARTRIAAASDNAAREQILAAEQLKASYIGHLGHLIEPAIAPLGYDWRLGIGLLSSFMAREVFVSVMGITFAVGESDESSVDLRRQLQAAAWPDGRLVLTAPAGVGLMVFYVFACQCISTLAVVKKETQSWRWPIFMFAYMSVLAYAAALAVYQIGSRL
ncbi:MAG: ferrous iron transport protein B [Phycisphaerae bacterium]|nr:MAG: ferrous iron transport protein B [Planctomycetia bacterium]RIK70574.1 MAG: ferrous iron transport protein B [Planctomycetota bacterium]GJQ26255.1 MAG: ferrous iron transport protein B [Phycisphaerae bacterium]